MRLPFRASTFFAKLVGYFVLTYLLWLFTPLRAAYANLLLATTKAALWLSEFSTDPLWSHGSTLFIKPGTETDFFYMHRIFAVFSPPLRPQGIQAAWVVAGLLVLVPLMLATPAPSWTARFVRLGVALMLLLLLQTLDLVVTIKDAYAHSPFGNYWGPWSRSFYSFLDALFQGFDTQLFPVMIWGGIHFQQLLGDRVRPPAPPVTAQPTRPTTKAKRRRAARERRT